MKAIIMAGGEGTRLKSVTGSTPKPMAPLAGRPVLEHILRLLKKNGFTEVCLTLRYRPEVIMDWLGTGERFGLLACYHVEERPMGTAGGVRACLDFYQQEDFLVISGDCACDFDLAALMEAHLGRRPAVTMALYSHASPLEYGTVLTDRKGRVVSFQEKPDWERVVSDLVNTGVYVVSPEAMDFVPEDQPFDFSQNLFPGLLEMQYEIQGVRMPGYWCDIGCPRAYYQCNLDALDGKLKLEGEGEGAEEKTGRASPAVQAPLSGHGLTLRCRDRARVMRELSQSLMEAGADYTDGLRLREGKGSIHIAPSPYGEALTLSAEAENGVAATELLQKYRQVVERIQSRVH